VSGAVLDAALQLVETHGLSGFSIGELARRSGVHETTIYRRWGDLDHLLVETLLERVEGEIPEPNTDSLRGDVVAMLRAAVRFCFSETGQRLLRALASVGQEATELKRRFWMKKAEVLDRVLERARARTTRLPSSRASLAQKRALSP
jgi:AcrR family transcriptional regulator